MPTVSRRIICGSRVRVEVSTGMPRRSRYDRPPARRPFDPNDRCYECGEKGHYAYDCHRYSRRRRSRYVRGRGGRVASPARFCVVLVSKEQNVTPVLTLNVVSQQVYITIFFFFANTYKMLIS